MKCPVCVESDLVMSERQGIEIDYCAKCRGVWLDRGELDKIIERAAREDDEREGRGDDESRRQVGDHGRGYAGGPPPPPPVAPPPPHYPPPGGYPPQQYPYPEYGGHGGHPKYYKKRKGFWSDLFDD